MPAPLQIVLTLEEDRTLSELRVAKTVSQRTRDRAHMLRLNAQGWTAPAIAEIFQCQEHTVRQTLRRWQQDGLGGLWDANSLLQHNELVGLKGLGDLSRYFSRLRSGVLLSVSVAVRGDVGFPTVGLLNLSLLQFS